MGRGDENIGGNRRWTEVVIHHVRILLLYSYLLIRSGKIWRGRGGDATLRWEWRVTVQQLRGLRPGCQDEKPSFQGHRCFKRNLARRGAIGFPFPRAGAGASSRSMTASRLGASAGRARREGECVRCPRRPGISRSLTGAGIWKMSGTAAGRCARPSQAGGRCFHGGKAPLGTYYISLAGSGGSFARDLDTDYRLIDRSWGWAGQ